MVLSRGGNDFLFRVVFVLYLFFLRGYDEFRKFCRNIIGKLSR